MTDRDDPRVDKPYHSVPKLDDEQLAEMLVDGMTFYDGERPRLRADCVGGYRPCPWLTCRYHLAVDPGSMKSGKTKLRTLNGALLDAEYTCLLDFVDDHPHGAEGSDVAVAMSYTRQREWQIEQTAIANMRAAADSLVDICERAENDIKE